MSKKPDWKPYVAAPVQIVTVNPAGGEKISAGLCTCVYSDGETIDAMIFPGSSHSVAIEHEIAAKERNKSGVGFAVLQYWRRPRHD
jgi:hypothetical protein